MIATSGQRGAQVIDLLVEPSHPARGIQTKQRCVSRLCRPTK
jgi:hypothetical protein